MGVGKAPKISFETMRVTKMMSWILEILMFE
jgi:hypothetical protein